MNMKRIEAETLEEAYIKASKEFGCSITEINYEIIQHPTTGMMGLFKKSAIIVAARKVVVVDSDDKKDIKKVNKSIKETPVVVKEKKSITKDKPKEKSIIVREESNKVLDSFFENRQEDIKEEKILTPKFDDDRDSPQNRALSIEIEKKIIELMQSSCFDIDTVEVDVFRGIAHIFIDGEDAALLIGKEGYRYNALSYMFFNWINAHYNLYIKLEIAEFIQSQEEMIVNYLKPIIEHIQQKGRGKTKPLDGILVQIALELLRAEFPNKYVAIKTARDGRKFIIINDFNSSKK
jgi:spoIIIJ-associated protein